MTGERMNLRLHLLNTGYVPVPCHGKKVFLEEWSTKLIDSNEIESWETNKRKHDDNTGIRTLTTPTFDVDITDEPAAEAVEDLIRKKFEEHGQILVRIGKPPKRAIPFRTDQPFLKIICNFIAPNGSEQKIEFLGEGQQFVAFGIHPDTNQPYRWSGGDPSTVPQADLPYISSQEAYELVDDVVVLLTKEFGYTRIKGTRKSIGKTSDKKIDGGFVWSTGFGNKKLKEYCDLVQEAKQHHWDEACRSVFYFGRLCGGGACDPKVALDALLKAAQRNATAPDDYKFTIKDTPSKVERSFLKGVADPTGPFVEEASLEDFLAYLPQHNYIYIPTRELWPAASINAAIPSVDKDLKASTWLDQHRPVQQMTWAPGEGMLIRDRLIADGGWFDRPGDMCFNLYKPAVIKEGGDANKAGPWLELVNKVYGTDAKHLITWFAHRVQRPGEKVNHGLLMIGAPGIGKDTILEPVKSGVGPWNFREVSPQALLGRFNGFLKSTVLRVSEARDLGEMNRYAFYEHTKTMMAAPPDVLPVDEKNLREHQILNCVGVIITSNHLTGGIYLPADDRRHYVAYSSLTSADFDTGYWTRLWQWYEQGGIKHVAALLHEYDISMFDPKAPPGKTDAFWQIVESNRAPENAELEDILDELGRPRAVSFDQIERMGSHELKEWLRDRKNCKVVPHRLGECGYRVVPNPDNKQGLWAINRRRQNIYALAALNTRDQIIAAQVLRREEEKSSNVVNLSKGG